MSKKKKQKWQKAQWKHQLDPSDIKNLLRILRENRRKIKDNRELYYDGELDLADREEYYRGTAGSELEGLALYYKYHSLVHRTHRNEIPYFLSKDLYLYTWVDLHPDGSAKSIYSSKKEDPEALIIEDNETIRKKYDKLRQLSHRVQLYGFDSLNELKAFEESFKMNTEHVVPQSWFGGTEPMKGDLHHLFICQPECNIARSNYPYADFDFYNPEQDEEPVKNDCGVSTGFLFEPEHGKGTVARAMLYFFLRYQRSIKREFSVRIDVPLLKRWAVEFPPSLYEKHRNQAIYYIQGNRNPFIDFPELAHRIRFPL